MRLTSRLIAAAVISVMTGVALTSCGGSDLPMPPNGPNPQSFSTNNALLRIVNGSPTAGSACNVGGAPTTCIDVVVDGTTVARGVPYPVVSALDQFAILPYVSVPSGQALIQIYQAGTTKLLYGLPVSVSANKKYSFVLAGQAPLPPPSPPFFQGYLFNDGLFNSTFGSTMADFHNASPNAVGVQFQVTCNACQAGGQPIGNPSQNAGAIVGPVSLIPSANYTLGTATQSIPASALGTNPGSVLPDPKGKPNVSIYLVDTVGGSGNFQVIGIEDSNG
jgi:hypothetical protein